jgi:release factor glutamine methyltransferase
VPALIPSPCGTKIAASARTTATRARRAAGRLAVRVGYLLFGRHRHRRLAVERIGPWTVVVFPDVFNPKLFRTGEVLALTLDEVLVPPGSAVLDLGTGSGIGAIAAARFTPRVSAVDLSPEAIRCARVNCAVNRVEDRVDLRQGDLFTPVGGERFDVVLFNPPFFRGIPKDLFDRSWRSPDVAERFAAGLADHLTPDGHALVVLSSDGDPAGFLRALRANAFAVDVVARRDFLNETLTIYRARAERGGRCA